MAYDVVRREVIAFGGRDAATGLALGDTWLWNGTAWRRASPATSPNPSLASAMAFDAEHAVVVLHDGESDNTYTWNGTTWQERELGLGPSPRFGFSFAYDARRRQTVLFGGQDASFGPFYNDTWTWDGATWSLAAPATSPPQRKNGASAFDPVRGVVVLFGGESPAEPLGDTWTWDGMIWSEQSPSRTPGARSEHAMTFDARWNDVVLFGGYKDVALGDTWRWNGVTWTQAAPRVAPTARSSHAVAFDEARGQTVLHGGTFDGTETWLLLHPGAACATAADCGGSLGCVDAVCCTTSSCGSCESCNGLSPGECAPVLNAPDADTCALADGKSCNDVGVCKAALGTPATNANECASGLVADGVCCDRACTGCSACRADLKASGTLSGTCDAVRAGADPHDACSEEMPATCGQDGSCDGQGACRAHVRNTPCGNVACVDNRATSLVCDGAGTCSASPVGVACGHYACREPVGCASTCDTDDDCGFRAHCDRSTRSCIADAVAACDGATTVVSPDGTRTSCGMYTCVDGACLTACNRITDCATGATCTFTGKCEASGDTQAAATEEGCRLHGSSLSPSDHVTGLLAFWTLGIVGRRTRRRCAARRP